MRKEKVTMRKKEKEKENNNNIRIIVHEDGSKKFFPAEGRFEMGQLKYATHVKKAFGREHMWIRIVSCQKAFLLGTVDNIPIFKESPALGTQVKVRYSEIEDAC